MTAAALSYFYPDGTVRKKPWRMSMHDWKMSTSTDSSDITLIATLDAMITAWYKELPSLFLSKVDTEVLDNGDYVAECNTSESGGIALKKLLSINPRVLNDAKERADLIDLVLSAIDIEGKLYQSPVLPHILDLATVITTTFPFDFLCRLITMHFRSLETYESRSANIAMDPSTYGIITPWVDVHYECPYLWVLLLIRQHAPKNLLR